MKSRKIKAAVTALFVSGVFLSAAGTALAEYDCGIFSLSERSFGYEYKTCDECLRDNRRCEKRCVETGYVCTAEGSDRYDISKTVGGDFAKRKKRARRSAVQACQDQGLRGCVADRCYQEQRVDESTVEKCFKEPERIGRRDRERSREMEHSCAIFSSSGGDRQRDRREYRSCDECLERNSSCEERCAEEGYICTAAGYDRRGSRKTVEGDLSERKRRAKRTAVQSCRDRGLDECRVEYCNEEQQFSSNNGTPCRNTSKPPVEPKKKNKKKKNKKIENKKIVKAPSLPTMPKPVVVAAVAKKYVVSWQHIKGRCEGKPHPKIAQQCGNRVNFWHGISCRVTWSDGQVSNLHGKVDQVDAYGRSYCTRATRPAKFNCVSSCDNTNGALMTLPRP